MKILVLISLIPTAIALASFSKGFNNNQKSSIKVVNKSDSSIESSTTKLEKGGRSVSKALYAKLTAAEQLNVQIYRDASPSVAYVTSFLTRRSGGSNKFARRRSSRGRSQRNRRNNDQQDENPSRGQSLGSGSGFVVSEDGYIVTNYHVIQRAYQMNEMMQQLRNSTFTKMIVKPFSSLQEYGNNDPAQVSVRINSRTKYLDVRVVDVAPQIDVAVLKVEDEEEKFPSYLEFGTSDELLVGQGVIAIGNPFGLDRTVTTGVVSALDREVEGIAGNTIRNCVQTDAAINPGNSGGPLLSTEGKVVGVNTMIITTSGSSAGIGFAVPSDQVKREVTRIIDKDRVKQKKRPAPGSLGIEVASRNMTKALLGDDSIGVLITNVQQNSPAAEAGIKGTSIGDNGEIIYGDRIVAINGDLIHSIDSAIYQDFRKRVVGEKVNLTLEAADGRRIVELTMVAKKE